MYFNTAIIVNAEQQTIPVHVILNLPVLSHMRRSLGVVVSHVGRSRISRS